MKTLDLKVPSAIIFFPFLALLCCTNAVNSQTYNFLTGLNNEFGFPNPANMRVFDGPENLNALLTEGELTIFEDSSNMAYIRAEYTEIEDSTSFWTLEMELSNGMNWDEWSTQEFPTSYRNDSEMVGDEYQDWSYYIMTCGQLIGSGNREGSHYDLVHAPINNFYAFQLGYIANNWNSSFGATTWTTGSGNYTDVLENEEFSVSSQFTFNFDIDSIPSASEMNFCDGFSAGADISATDLCSAEVQLWGTHPCGESGEWSLISGLGTFEDASDQGSIFTPSPGISLLEWNYECQDSTYLDTLQLFYSIVDPEIPNAGDNLSIDFCENDSVMLNANEVLEPGLNYWSLIEGCPLEFSDINSPNTTLTGLIPGEYQLLWTHELQLECTVLFSDSLTISVESCGEVVEDCQILQGGCSLEFATNYNSEAQADDGSCEFDFTVCDCLGNVHTPYIYLNLGDSIVNDSDSLNFNCELWGFDCGDIDPEGDADICQNPLTPNYGCADNVFSLDSEKPLTIYPNPASNTVSILLDNSAEEIILYSAAGSLVKSFLVKGVSGQVELDFHSISEGIYTLHYGAKTERLVIKK